MASPTINSLALKEKIESLQEAIHTAHPRMPVLLKEIHKLLRDDPEVVTVMTEEEIGIIVAGLKKQTDTEIVTATPAKAAKAALRKVEVDDL